MQRRVLFVCLGNSCRSQMAEAFARAYGKDVMEARSAGLAPAAVVVGGTHQVMLEKNIRMEDHYPKALSELGLTGFDMIVNMSGFDLPIPAPVPVRTWPVDDPIGLDEETYRRVRDEIEHKVMGLILEFRREDKGRNNKAKV